MSTDVAAAAEETARLKQYKNTAKHEDMRRRRTECSVEIRKQKRDDLMMKRRNLVEEEDDGSSPDPLAEQSMDGTVSTTTSSRGPPKFSLDEVLRILMNSPTVEQMQDAFESLRKSLSKSRNPPVDEVINMGLVPALIAAFEFPDDKVQFEAAWALTNIVSGTSQQTMFAVEQGCTPPLVRLTCHENLALAEQALWALANIAGESAQMRDYIIASGGVEAMMSLAAKVSTLTESFARTIAWAFSNMCRHKNPHAPLPVLTVLAQGLTVLIAHQDKTVRQDACWALSYLTDGPDAQIQVALDTGVMPTIVGFLRESESLVAPALRVLGNMATGSDDLTQKVIDLGTLNELPHVVKRAKSSSVVKECCWLISNVIAGTQLQIQAVIDASLLPLLVDVAKGGDYKCQFEVSWALANLAQGGTATQQLELVDEGALGGLCALLHLRHNDLLTNALETMHSLLTTVSTHRPSAMDRVCDEIEECGGLDDLEKLQEHEMRQIYEQAYRIVSEFFGNEDEEELNEFKENENIPTVYKF